MSNRRRRLYRATYCKAIGWILARDHVRVGWTLRGPGFRAHGIVTPPRRPRWARWMTRKEWAAVWTEAATFADFSRRIGRLQREPVVHGGTFGKRSSTTDAPVVPLDLERVRALVEQNPPAAEPPPAEAKP